MTRRYVPKPVPDTYDECVYTFGWHLSNIGLDENASPFARDSHEHALVVEAHQDRRHHMQRFGDLHPSRQMKAVGDMSP